MDYYLSFNNNEERIRLPVIPSSFEVSIPQKMLCSNMGIYEIIKSAYEGASKQNKKKYHITMNQGKLYVKEVGKKVLDYILKADTNILESAYSENAEGVVNRVKIYDEKDQYLGLVQDDELIGLVGVF